ncbi:MAG: VanZ family protein [Pyrinomonadaceae bacterium]|nr:VanZ family protein [Pyrinomonadaceae bacterium]
MSSFNDNTKGRSSTIAIASLVIWIGIIFYMSSGQGSMDETSRFIRPLLEFLFPAASPETITLYHAFIRKCAHFTEYAILTLLAYRAITNEKLRLIAPLILVVAVASLDEYNQSFESTRTGSINDVLLDIAGGATMAAVIWGVVKIRRQSVD